MGVLRNGGEVIHFVRFLTVCFLHCAPLEMNNPSPYFVRFRSGEAPGRTTGAAVVQEVL